MAIIPRLSQRAAAWLDANFARGVGAIGFTSADFLLGSRLQNLADLGSRVVNKGASLVGVQDAGNYFTAPYNVESVLQQIGAALAGGSGGGTITEVNGQTGPVVTLNDGNLEAYTGWTQVSAADLELVYEITPGDDTTLTGDNDGTGPVGATLARKGERSTLQTLYVLPLPAPLADGQRVAIDFGLSSSHDGSGYCVPAILAVKENPANTYTGGALIIDTSNATPFQRTALTFDNAGAISFSGQTAFNTRKLPRFVAFTNESGALFIEYSESGLPNTWERGSGTNNEISATGAEITHIGLMAYYNGNYGWCSATIRQYEVQDV